MTTPPTWGKGRVVSDLGVEFARFIEHEARCRRVARYLGEPGADGGPGASDAATCGNCPHHEVDGDAFVGGEDDPAVWSVCTHPAWAFIGGGRMQDAGGNVADPDVPGWCPLLEDAE